MKISLICVFLLSSIFTFAQWTSQTAVNTEVSTSESSDMKSLGTVSGKTVIIFWKAVPAPVYYELRMQVLSTTGQKLLGPEGTLVSNSMSMSSSTAIMKISVDQNENVYIGATGTSGGIGYAFKLNINGVHQWAANGINLGGGYVVTILPLSTGEAVIAWNSSNQTLIQKYSSSGNPIWSVPQQVSNGASNGKSPADLFELSNNEFLLVFHVLSFGVNSTLWAQKYSSAGNPIWSNPMQLSNKTTAWNALYSSAQEGDVVYYGYRAATGTHFDSFLQRINPDGTLPWGINGKDFDISVTRNEMDTKIAFFPNSNFVWSICNYANSSQSAYGVYIQKFDKTSGLRMFTDTAKVVYPIGSSRVNSGDLLLLNDQPIFLLKDGFDNGATPTTLNACLLNTQGNFAWTYQYAPMATYSANKSRIHFSKANGSRVVATFVETKANGFNKIYAHSIPVLDNGSTFVANACDSYTWINNITYTSSTNTPTVVLTNVNGGDSTVTLNLTINYTTSDTLNVTTCNPYVWNGNTYTNSGLYVGQTTNCNTHYLNLSIVPVTIDTTVISACDQYTWNGVTYTSSGTYSGTPSNCTTPLLQLTINPSTSDTTYINSCGSYVWNGIQYDSTGIYSGLTINCQTSYLNLTIVPITVSVDTQGMTLTANSNGQNFQWLDCENNLAPIPSATNQSFTPSVSGTYAVVVGQGNCSDTSECISVSDAGIQQVELNEWLVWPNPASTQLSIKRSALVEKDVTIQIVDIQGRILLSSLFDGIVTVLDIEHLASGCYLIQLEDSSASIRFVKK